MAVASDTGLDAVRDLEKATGMSRRELELMASLDSKGFKDIAGTMNMTTTEMMKIINAGKDLEDFAQVAGMTAEQFKKAYEVDAVGAISAFVQGLGNATDKGETAITMLDEMGISEVRLRDTLLRTGSAQELFTDAVNTSTKAWEENTALTDEANIRYETTASQLQLLKNEVTGMAIDLGTELLPVLLDFVEMAKPMMEGIKDMIRGFADSSDETKKFVGSMLGLVVAGGPVLKSITTTGQSIGWLSKNVGTGMTTLFNFGKTSMATKQSLEVLDDATIGMTGSAAKLAGKSGMGGALATSSSFLGTLGPLALGVAGVTAVVALGYGAWKLWGEEAYNSSERTKKWGSDVGEEADKAATEFVEMADEIALATEKMAVDVEGGASQVIETYGEMGDSIITDIQETITEAEEGLASLPESVREIVGESLMEGIGDKEALVTEVQTIQSEITAIYQQAMEENREISENELTIIENYNNRLAEIRSETLGLEAEEQKKVHAIMAEDLKNFTKEQLIQREWLIGEEQVAVKKGYAEHRELLESELASGALVQKEYDAAMSALRNEEIAEMTALGAEYVKIWRERGGVSKEIQEAALKDLGVTMEQVEQYLALNNEKVKNASNIMIESSEEASAKTKEANEAWNSMELLDKEGNVKTNVKEVIQEASQSEEGWEQLQFIMHNAELDTNAMEIIRGALMAEGKWWQIELPAKFAEMQTNSPEEAIKFLQAHGIWESLPFETQTAILDSNSTEEVANIMKDHEAWKNIPWRERQALVSTNTRQTVTTATKGHATWEGQKWNDKHAKIEVTTNAQSVAAIARREIGSVTGKTVILKTRYETSGSAPKGIGPTATRSAAGSNFLKGGPTILGDGGNHEPFMTPDGQFGLSPKQDTLYDLPRGTKVWRNIESLLSSLPHYANGTLNQPIKVGDKTFNQLTDALIPFSAPSVTQQSETVSESSSATLISGLIEGQRQMSEVLGRIMNSQGRPVYMNISNKRIGEIIVPIVDKGIGQNTQYNEGRILL